MNVLFRSLLHFIYPILHLPVCLPEAMVHFQWADHIHAEAKKPILLINMDETSLAMSLPNTRGTVIMKRWRPKTRKVLKRQHLKQKELRSRFTHMSFVTHNSLLQPALPQILICNKSQCTQKELREIRAQLPPNFFIWQEKSAWNNHALTRRALTLLNTHMQDYFDVYQVVLLSDVARSHLRRSISLLARRYEMPLLYVPARLTWLLQPADTHVFAKLKQALRVAWTKLRSESVAGDVATKTWVMCMS